MFLNPGDYVELYGYQDPGATLSALGDNTWSQMHWLGFAAEKAETLGES